jgi:hypothetical protein
MTRSGLRKAAARGKDAQRVLYKRFGNGNNAKAMIARRRLGLWVEYAETKILAMGQRLAGRIHAASVAEQICDNIYGAMPKGMRW